MRANLICSDGIQYVRRRSGERMKENCLLRTVKHPAGQMIWGCLSYHGLGELAFVKGMVNSEVYKTILINHLTPSIEKPLSVADEVIFQDDSAPCHRSKMVSSIFFIVTLHNANKFTTKLLTIFFFSSSDQTIYEREWHFDIGMARELPRFKPY